MRGRSDFESSEVMMSRIFGLMFKKLKLERVIIGLEEWVFLWLTIFYDKRRMEELFLDVFFRFFLKGKKKKTKIEPEVNSKKNSSPTELGLSRLIYDSSSMWKNMKNLQNNSIFIHLDLSLIFSSSTTFFPQFRLFLSSFWKPGFHMVAGKKTSNDF